MTESRDGMVVYWRPGCPFCLKLRIQLLFTRIRHTKVNIWQDRAAADVVRSVADGNETVPTVTVAGKSLVNPSRRHLLETVREHAPHLLR